MRLIPAIPLLLLLLPAMAAAQTSVIEFKSGSCFNIEVTERTLRRCPAPDDGLPGDICGGNIERHSKDQTSWWHYDRVSPSYSWIGSGSYYVRDRLSGMDPWFGSLSANWGQESCEGGGCTLHWGARQSSQGRNMCFTADTPPLPLDMPNCVDPSPFNYSDEASDVSVAGQPVNDGDDSADGGMAHIACTPPNDAGCVIMNESYECADPATGAGCLHVQSAFWNCGENDPNSGYPVFCPNMPGNIQGCATWNRLVRGWYHMVSGSRRCSDGCPNGWECCSSPDGGESMCLPQCERRQEPCAAAADCAYMGAGASCQCGACVPPGLPPTCGSDADCPIGLPCISGSCSMNCGEGACSASSDCSAEGSCCVNGQCVAGVQCLDGPQPSPSPSPTPDNSPTPTPTPDATATIATPTPHPTVTSTAIPGTPTPTPTATRTPTGTVSTPAPTATATPTPTPTVWFTATPTPDGGEVFLRN